MRSDNIEEVGCRAVDVGGIGEWLTVVKPLIGYGRLTFDSSREHHIRVCDDRATRGLCGYKWRPVKRRDIAIKCDRVVVGVAEHDVAATIEVEVADGNAPRIPTGGVVHAGCECDVPGSAEVLINAQITSQFADDHDVQFAVAIDVTEHDVVNPTGIEVNPVRRERAGGETIGGSEIAINGNRRVVAA